jgi:hypothetical protein
MFPDYMYLVTKLEINSIKEQNVDTHQKSFKISFPEYRLIKPKSIKRQDF